MWCLSVTFCVIIYVKKKEFYIDFYNSSINKKITLSNWHNITVYILPIKPQQNIFFLLATCTRCGI